MQIKDLRNLTTFFVFVSFCLFVLEHARVPSLATLLCAQFAVALCLRKGPLYFFFYICCSSSSSLHSKPLPMSRMSCSSDNGSQRYMWRPLGCWLLCPAQSGSYSQLSALKWINYNAARGTQTQWQQALWAGSNEGHAIAYGTQWNRLTSIHMYSTRVVW